MDDLFARTKPPRTPGACDGSQDYAPSSRVSFTATSRAEIGCSDLSAYRGRERSSQTARRHGLRSGRADSAAVAETLRARWSLCSSARSWRRQKSATHSRRHRSAHSRLPTALWLGSGDDCGASRGGVWNAYRPLAYRAFFKARRTSEKAATSRALARNIRAS